MTATPTLAGSETHEGGACSLTPAMTDLVVLCGGRGTRLGPLTAVTPKPLLPVGGHPFLLKLLLRMKHQGIGRVVLATHYLADQFHAFATAYRNMLPALTVVVEPEPLGTGGALRHVVERVQSSTFVAVNGDTWVTQPLEAVLREHAQTAREATAVVVKTSQVEGEAAHKGVWRVGPGQRVEGLTTPARAVDGWVNAGLYVFSRALICSWPRGRYNVEEHVSSLLSGRRAGVFYSAGCLLDIGTPQCYALANRTWERFDPVGRPG